MRRLRLFLVGGLLLLVPFAASAATVGAGGWIGNWSPGIGDPTPIGWITALAYLIAAGLCFTALPAAGRVKVPAQRRKEVFLWWFLGCLLVFLGLNKQLDLQTAFTEVLRMMAFDEGWYGRRRLYQEGFILTIALWSALGLAGLVWLTRRLAAGARIAVAGMVFVLAYVVVRAASFHYVDIFINSSVLGIRYNWVLELGGILIIIGGAGARLLSASRGSPDGTKPPTSGRSGTRGS